MIKGVIFDLDGVLLKFNINSKKIKEDIIRFFVENGLKEGIFSPSDSFSIIREGVRRHFIQMGRDSNWVDDLLRNGEKIAIGYEVEAARKAELLPNAKEVLDILKTKGLRLAVFTYNNSQAAEIGLKKNGIMDFFDAVVARDSVLRPKPNPEHLNAVLEKLGIEPNEAIVVGDSEMDIKPCKKLGVRVVAVTTGVRTEEELRKFNPDFVIKDLRELPDLIEGSTGSKN
ncbi:MAG: HAD family hydrolase [Candidatus Methanomethylicaceae archaeon]